MREINDKELELITGASDDDREGDDDAHAEGHGQLEEGSRPRPSDVVPSTLSTPRPPRKPTA